MTRTKNNDLQIALSHATSALELIASPIRPDGTYNRCRAACEKLAVDALVQVRLALAPEVDAQDVPTSGTKTDERILDNTLADEVRLQTSRADAYKWGYGYLQNRMEGLQRPGWAHDCDSEIEHRISVKHTCADTVKKLSPAAQDISEVRKEKTTNRISFRKP